MAGELRSFITSIVIGSFRHGPAMSKLSRCLERSEPERVVDELIIRFTHTQEMPFWLPGITPTGRRVEIPLVVVMGFDGDQVASEHIYWDQASLLAQVGLLKTDELPITGAVQAHALVDPGVRLNGLIADSGETIGGANRT